MQTFLRLGFLFSLALTAAYGGLGKACGAKLASLAFEGSSHPHFRDLFMIFSRIFCEDIEFSTLTKMSTLKNSEKLLRNRKIVFAKSKFFFGLKPSYMRLHYACKVSSWWVIWVRSYRGDRRQTNVFYY